jgi:putative colanic acid biosynthesis acetyltransferase WcaF
MAALILWFCSSFALPIARSSAMIYSMTDPKMPTSSAIDTAAVRLVSSAPASWKIRRLLWSIVQNTLYRYSFHTWSRWRCMLLRLFGAKIGENCTIRRTSRVYYPWLLEMEELGCLGDDVVVYNLGLVRLGARSSLSQEAYLCAGTHDYTSLAMPLVTAPIIIGADAWICARAFIGPGVTVGDGAVVGACAVAMKDVPAWTVVAGNPARAVKKRVMSNVLASGHKAATGDRV